jgi:hypothetical protein
VFDTYNAVTWLLDRNVEERTAIHAKGVQP